MGFIPEDVLDPYRRPTAPPVKKTSGTDGDDTVASVLDDEFSKLGYPSTSRISILGDVGRENGWNRDTIFKGHPDPANGAYNRGIISWQKERQQGLEQFLKQQGVYGRNNDDELRGMARFMDHELRRDYPTVLSKLLNPKSTYDASEALRQYIKYNPEGGYNSFDPDFRVANNAKWAKRAQQLGLGAAEVAKIASMDDVAALYGNATPQTAPTATPQTIDDVAAMYSQPTAPMVPTDATMFGRTSPLSPTLPNGQVRPTATNGQPMMAPSDIGKAPTSPTVAGVQTIKDVPTSSATDQAPTVARQLDPTYQDAMPAPPPLTFTDPKGAKITQTEDQKGVPAGTVRVVHEKSGKPYIAQKQGANGTYKFKAEKNGKTVPPVADQAALDDAATQNTQFATEDAEAQRQPVVPVTEQNKYSVVSDTLTPPANYSEEQAAQFIRKQLADKYGEGKFDNFSFLGNGYHPGRAVNITYGALKDAGIDADALLAEKGAQQRTEQNQGRSTVFTPESDPLKEQARENIMANPLSGGTDADLQAEYERLQRTALNDEETKNAVSVGDYIEGVLNDPSVGTALGGDANRQLAGGAASGLIESVGGKTTDFLAGLYKYTLPGMIDSARGETGTADAMTKFANRAKVVGASAKGDGVIYDIGNVAGNLAGDAPRLVGLTALTGGNPIIAFGLDETLRSAGRGETAIEQAKFGIKGAIFGAIFHGASRLGGAVEENLTNAILPKQSVLGLTGGVRPKSDVELVTKIIGEAARIGTVGAGTFATAKVEGASTNDAFYQTALMLLTDLGFHHQKYGEMVDLSGKVFRLWKNGEYRDFMPWMKEQVKGGKAEVYDVTGKVRDDQVQAVISDEDIANARNVTPQKPKQIEGKPAEPVESVAPTEPPTAPKDSFIPKLTEEDVVTAKAPQKSDQNMTKNILGESPEYNSVKTPKDSEPKDNTAAATGQADTPPAKTNVAAAPTISKLPPHLQELASKMQKQMDERGGGIEDVTPAGFGPDEPAAEESFYRDPNEQQTVEEQKLRRAIQDGETLLKGDVTGEKRGSIERAVASAQAKLDVIEAAKKPKQPSAEDIDKPYVKTASNDGPKQATPTLDTKIRSLFKPKAKAVDKSDIVEPDARPTRTIRTETGPELRESREPKGRASKGAETVVRIPDSKDGYKARYALRELEDVVPSHDPHGFQPNADYFYKNDRHYDKEQQYQEQVRTRSKSDTFDPSQLVNNNPTSETGPPIIDQDGNVLGGNSRSMILHRIYTDANENTSNTAATAYQNALKKDSRIYGITTTELARYKQPVLVRVIDDASIDPQSAITELNKTSTTALTSGERSIAEAGRLTDEAVDHIAGKIEAAGADATLTEALNANGIDIVNKLIDEGVFSGGERNTLLDGNKITADGKARIERLLTGRIFDDLEQFEFAPAYLKKNIQRAIAPLIKTQGDTEWDIIPDTREAIDLLTEYKAKATSDETLEQYANQPSLLKTSDWSKSSLVIAKVLRDGPNAVGRAFKTYAGDYAMAKSGGGLFGASTQGEAFDAAFNENNDLHMSVRSPEEKVRDVFYSQLERSLEAKMPARASSDQVRGIIKDAKSEEKEWLGIDGYLDEHPVVERQDLLEFIRANNVTVREVVKGEVAGTGDGNINATVEDAERALREDGEYTVSPAVSITREPGGDYSVNDEWADDGTLFRTLPEAVEYVKDRGYIVHNPTKYGTYTLPGAEPGSYRELLLTMPEAQAAPNENPYINLVTRIDLLMTKRERRGLSEAETSELNQKLQQQNSPEFAEERKIRRTKKEWDKFVAEATPPEPFKGGHFSEPNILAHVRFDDRDGGKTLHIAELQSDWHQRARDVGYKADKPLDRANAEERGFSVYKTKSNLGSDAYFLKGPESRRDVPSVGHDTEDAAWDALLKYLERTGDSRVPDAPFKKSWPLMAFKHTLRYAAANGYERITFDTGETQAARYDLSKHIDKIQYWKTDDGKFGFVAQKGRDDILEKDNLTQDDLAQNVGKEVAEKIANNASPYNPNGEHRGVLAGLDLKINPTGMTMFYDKMLPNEVNKYVKKFGARVEEGTIDTHLDKGAFYEVQDEENETVGTFTDKESASTFVANSPMTGLRVVGSPAAPVHSVTITPAMRDAALAGQPLFKAPTAERAAELQTYADIEQFEDEHLSQIKPTVVGDTIIPDMVSHELMRTAKAMIAGKERSEAGLSMGWPMTPTEVKGVIGIFTEMGKGAKEAGYDPAGFQRIVKALKQAAKRDGHVAWALPEGIGHEGLHVADARAATDAAGQIKSFEKRYDGATDQLRSDPDFQQFRAALVDLQGPTTHGASMAEALAWLGEGDHGHFDITKDQSINILATLVTGIAKESGVDALSHFKEGTEVYEIINDIRAKGGFGDGRTESGSGSGSGREAGPETTQGELGPNDRPQTGGESEKGPAEAKIGVPAYAKKHLDTKDVTHTVEPMATTKAKGEAALRGSNLHNILEQVRTATSELPAQMSVLYEEQKRLNSLASAYRKDGKEAEYSATINELTALSADIITAQLQSGRAVNIAKTLEPLSGANAVNVALKLKRHFTGNENAELPKKVAEAFQQTGQEQSDAAEVLAKATDTIEKLRKRVADLEAGEYRFGTAKPKRNPTGLQKAVSEKLGRALDAEIVARIRQAIETPLAMATKDGKPLLAPNGKPSNLSPELHAMVRTPAFKEWFGDWENDPENASQILDKNKEPLVLYHGTNYDFDEFRTDLGEGTREGLFFTADKRVASGYAGRESQRKWVEGANVVPVFLSIKNPYRVDFKGGLNVEFDGERELADEGGHDGMVLANVVDYYFNEKPQVFPKRETQYVAFKPAQIKSIFNRTFDPNDASILKMAVKTAPKLAADIRDKVAEVGAKILNDGLQDEYDETKFKVDLLKTFGDDFAPYLPEAIALASDHLQTVRNEIKHERLVASYKEQGMDAERAERQATKDVEDADIRRKQRSKDTRSIKALANQYKRNSALEGNLEDLTDDPNVVHAGMILGTEKALSTNILITRLRDDLGLTVQQARDAAKEARAALDKINEKRRIAIGEAKGKLPEALELERQTRAEQSGLTRKMNDMLRKVTDSKNLMQRFNNDVRAKLVLNYATQAFNVVQSLVTTMPMEIATDAIDSVMRAGMHSIGKTSDLDGIAPQISLTSALLPYAYLKANNRQVAEGILSEFPEEYFRLELGILPDVNLEGTDVEGRNPVSALGHKWYDQMDKLNGKLSTITLAKYQEAYFRSALFLATLDQVARNNGTTLEAVLKENRASETFTEDQVRYAVDKALRVTFASQINDPVGRTLKRFYDQTDKFLPVFLNPVTYARFTYTVARSVINAHTFGALDTTLLGGKGWNSRSFAKGIVGAISIGLGFALLTAYGGDDDKWYTIYFNGNDKAPLDIRRFFPLSAYVFTAHVIKSLMEGRGLPKAEEFLAGYASLEIDQYNRSAGLEFVKALYSYAGEAASGEVQNETKLKVNRASGKMLGYGLGAHLRFFEPFRKIFAQINEDERKMRKYDGSGTDEFVGELAKKLPLGSLYGAEVKKNPVTGKDLEEVFPVGRIFGLNYTHPMFTSPKPTVAEERAKKLLTTPYAGKDFTPDMAEAYSIRKEIKEAMRRKEITADDIPALVDKYVKEGKLSEKSAARLKKDALLTNLQETLKWNFAFGDAKDVDALNRVWRVMTDQEKADARVVLQEKDDINERVAEDFGLSLPRSLVIDKTINELQALPKAERDAKTEERIQQLLKAGEIKPEDMKKIRSAIVLDKSPEMRGLDDAEGDKFVQIFTEAMKTASPEEKEKLIMRARRKRAAAQSVENKAKYQTALDKVYAQ